MKRWLVFYYDGNENCAKIVEDDQERLPFNAEVDHYEWLRDKLSADSVLLNGMVELPDGMNPTVVVEDLHLTTEMMRT